MTLRKILSLNIWFLIGAILFLVAGIRHIIKEDTIGAIIDFLVVVLFLVGYVGQVKFNKKPEHSKKSKKKSKKK